MRKRFIGIQTESRYNRIERAQRIIYLVLWFERTNRSHLITGITSTRYNPVTIQMGSVDIGAIDALGNGKLWWYFRFGTLRTIVETFDELISEMQKRDYLR